MLLNRLCNYGCGPYADNFCDSSIKFGAVVQEEMLFKDISCLELWEPICSVAQNHLCNFGRVHHEEPLCEIFLNLDQWIRKRCRLKTLLI